MKNLWRRMFPPYEPKQVEVGRATVTVTFRDDLPDIVFSFEGFAQHSPAFGLFTSTGEGRAVAWTRTSHPIPMPDGVTYIPRSRVAAYKIAVEPLVVTAEKI